MYIRYVCMSMYNARPTWIRPYFEFGKIKMTTRALFVPFYNVKINSSRLTRRDYF